MLTFNTTKLSFFLALLVSQLCLTATPSPGIDKWRISDEQKNTTISSINFNNYNKKLYILYRENNINRKNVKIILRKYSIRSGEKVDLTLSDWSDEIKTSKSKSMIEDLLILKDGSFVASGELFTSKQKHIARWNDNGKLMWKKRLSYKKGPKVKVLKTISQMGHIICSCYSNNKSYLISISSRSGEEEWVKEFDNGTNPMIYDILYKPKSNVYLLAIQEGKLGKLQTGKTKNLLYKFSKESGFSKKKELSGRRPDIEKLNDKLILSADYGTGVKSDNRLVSLSQSFNKIWSKSINGVGYVWVSQPVLDTFQEKSEIFLAGTFKKNIVLYKFQPNGTKKSNISIDAERAVLYPDTAYSKNKYFISATLQDSGVKKEGVIILVNH